MPFTAATGTYVLASALALGTRNPLRWVVGAVLALFLIGALGDAAGVQALGRAPNGLLQWVLDAPYGFDALLTARTESLRTETVLATGRVATVWRGVPDLGHWAVATLLWTGAGLAALWAAVSRYRERRST